MMCHLLFAVAVSLGASGDSSEEVTGMPVAIVLEEGFSAAQLEEVQSVLRTAARLGIYYRTVGDEDWFAPYLVAAQPTVRDSDGSPREVDALGEYARCADSAFLVSGEAFVPAWESYVAKWASRCAPKVRTAIHANGLRLTSWCDSRDEPEDDCSKNHTVFMNVEREASAVTGALDFVAVHLGRQATEEAARRLQHAWRPPPDILNNVPRWNPRLDEIGQAFQEAYLNIRAQDWAAAEKAFDELTKRYPREAEMWYYLGLSRHNLGQWRAAIPAHEKAAELPGYIPYRALYNLACSYALLGETEAALAALRRSAEAGFVDHEHAARDSDLASLRDDARFAEALGTMRRTAAGQGRARN